MGNLKIYNGSEWVNIAAAHTHDPSVTGSILSGGSTDGQVLVWRDSANAWSGETLNLVTSHSGLTDLQSNPEENSDHDNRYLAAVQSGTPTLPASPVTGQLWYDTDAVATGSSIKQTHKKMLYVTSPVAGDEFPLMTVPFNCTITRISYMVDTGTCVFNLEERPESAPFTTGTNIFGSDETAYSAVSATTTFSNATLDENDWLYYSGVSVSGTPTKLVIGVTFTED